MHRPHSPFFILWELATLTCVIIVAADFLIVPTLELSEEILHRVELVVESSEIILVVEVALLLLVARDKIRYVRKNWPTILAALPVGGGFRFLRALKIIWHAFEKTKIGKFFSHPIRTSRRWVHINLGLRV